MKTKTSLKRSVQRMKEVKEALRKAIREQKEERQKLTP